MTSRKMGLVPTATTIAGDACPFTFPLFNVRCDGPDVLVCHRCSSCSPRCFPSALPLAIAGARRTGRCGTGSGRQSFKSPFALLLQSVAIRATEGDAGAASSSHRYVKLQLVRPFHPKLLMLIPATGISPLLAGDAANLW
jgi:hypothetical protein